MTLLNKENIVTTMLEVIPEIRPQYEKELEWWDEGLPHIVFGDVLNPYIINLLKTDKKEEVLERIFDFLEHMANSNNIYVQEVLVTTVLERLGDEKAVLKKAKELYMGEQTKRLSDDIEKAIGRG